MNMGIFFAGVAMAVLLLLNCATQIACHRKGGRFLYPSKLSAGSRRGIKGFFCHRCKTPWLIFHNCKEIAQASCPAQPAQLQRQIAAAIAFPTSSVPALPPMSRVRPG
jgi:hypothetical protein